MLILLLLLLLLSDIGCYNKVWKEAKVYRDKYCVRVMMT